jgi:hypothetical protein
VERPPLPLLVGPARQDAGNTVFLPQNGSAQFSRPRRLQNRTVRDFCAVSRPPSPPPRHDLAVDRRRSHVPPERRRSSAEVSSPRPLSPSPFSLPPCAFAVSLQPLVTPFFFPRRDLALPFRPAARSKSSAPACRPCAPSPCSFAQPRRRSSRAPPAQRASPLRVAAESLCSLRSLHAQLLSVSSAAPARNPRMLLTVPRYCYLAYRVLVKSHARGFARDHGYCARRRHCLHSPHAVSRVSRAQSARIS